MGTYFSRVTKGMYGLPQEGKISHDALERHVEHYGYLPSSKTPGLWTHNSWLINFTLEVNNFVVKYSGKEHALHLKSSLEDKCKVNIDRERKNCTLG